MLELVESSYQAPWDGHHRTLLCLLKINSVLWWELQTQGLPSPQKCKYTILIFYHNWSLKVLQSLGTLFISFNRNFQTLDQQPLIYPKTLEKTTAWFDAFRCFTYQTGESYGAYLFVTVLFNTAGSTILSCFRVRVYVCVHVCACVSVCWGVCIPSLSYMTLPTLQCLDTVLF